MATGQPSCHEVIAARVDASMVVTVASNDDSESAGTDSVVDVDVDVADVGGLESSLDGEEATLAPQAATVSTATMTHVTRTRRAVFADSVAVLTAASSRGSGRR
jgi:hypothetical protein